MTSDNPADQRQSLINAGKRRQKPCLQGMFLMPEKHGEPARRRESLQNKACRPSKISHIRFRSIHNFKDYFKR
jgi:hypothetical protein